MSQQSQLQFNLGVPANSRNLATHFSLAPSPVVLEKVPPRVTAVGLSQTPAHAFQAVSADRLALAIQLAKRDVRRGAVGVSTPQFARPSPVLTAPRDGSGENGHCDSVVSQIEAGLGAKTVKVVKENANHGAEESVIRQQAAVALVESEGNLKRKAVPSIDPSCREVVRLRKEIEQQVQKLKHLSERRRAMSVAREAGDKPVSRAAAPVVSGGGRVWWEPGEGEVERERRRRDEQAARNSRMLYNLQQQLTSLQRDVERLGTSDKSTKKVSANN